MNSSFGHSSFIGHSGFVIRHFPRCIMSNIIIPTPRCAVSVRPGTVADIPFIDQLQKMHSHMVGWMPTKQIEGKIAAGHVIVAEDAQHGPLGYCISQDQYHGRDDVGIVFQLNVLPLKQRHLIGATLIKVGVRARGVRVSAVLLAGARRTSRRTTSGNRSGSCRWRSAREVGTSSGFTSSGSGACARATRAQMRRRGGSRRRRKPARSARIDRVSRSRRDTHWRDAKPVVLPGITVEPELPKTLPGGAPLRTRPDVPQQSTAQRVAIIRSKSKNLQGLPAGKAAVITGNGLRYIDRGDHVPEVAATQAEARAEAAREARSAVDRRGAGAARSVSRADQRRLDAARVSGEVRREPDEGDRAGGRARRARAGEDVAGGVIWSRLATSGARASVCAAGAVKFSRSPSFPIDPPLRATYGGRLHFPVG
jgi:hypothetical protein